MMRRIAMCVASALLAGLAASARGGPAVGPGDLGTSDGCCFASNGFGYDACVFPPMVCPNGIFTDVETCAAGFSSPGCPGTMQDRVRWTTEETGLRVEQVSCFEMGQFYNTMRCRCTGNIFGWCVGPCTPTGGVGDAVVPCPGTLIRLVRCEDDG